MDYITATILVSAAILAAIMYAKMILIWKDAMLNRNERVLRDIERIKRHESQPRTVH